MGRDLEQDGTADHGYQHNNNEDYVAGRKELAHVFVSSLGSIQVQTQGYHYKKTIALSGMIGTTWPIISDCERNAKYLMRRVMTQSLGTSRSRLLMTRYQVQPPAPSDA